ncbi:MAG: phospholipase D-like domain-containing protein [bacterium]|nr:phospholipase D-like domain-containing protein [bacterium]
MNQKMIRAIIALILTLAAGTAGYSAGSGQVRDTNISIPAQTISVPAVGTTRIIYSLDAKQNDQELIALIDNAEDHIYFAIYTFTLTDVADALVKAKERGVVVKGLMDSEQSRSSYSAPIIAKFKDAGISVLTEKHASGNGIMHIKLLVTEKAYAFGSYNWTSSATKINDEILEVGTDPSTRQAHENILKRLFEEYRTSAAAGAAASVSNDTYDYTDASEHVGEYASVRGTLIKTYTSKTGTVFLDFCKEYKNCSFSGVIFADDAKKFGDLSRHVGTSVTLTGKISLYQNKAEIILSDPKQISN